MKNIKNTLAAVMVATVLFVGTGFAKGGLLMSDFAGDNQNQCEPTVNTGIIVTGFTGIIVTGFTGIIVTGLTSDSETSKNQTSCRGGILLSE